MPGLSEEEIRQRLAALPDWSLTPAGIRKTYRFPSFRKAIAFVDAVADLAEARQHHPEMEIRYDRVVVTSISHDVGCVTARDLGLAEQIEQLGVAWGSEGGQLAPTDAGESTDLRPGVGARLLAWWVRTPLYSRILGALVLGVASGVLLGERAGVLEAPARLVLRLLGALAPALIPVAVVHALLGAEGKGRAGVRLVSLLVLNTLVAIGIGLLVANVVQPGRHASLPSAPTSTNTKKPADVLGQMLENVPASLLRPLVDNQVIGVILIALTFGLALWRVREAEARAGQSDFRAAEALVNTAYRMLIVVFHWVIALVPIGVFGIIASVVGLKGFAPLKALGWFVVAVLLALLLPAAHYLTRIRIASWVRPAALLRGMRDGLVMAFSTASSTATMPVTYTCLRERVGLWEESASLGALVGANFNNDGTAVYEAMDALFFAQMLGMELGLHQQLMVVLTSVVASVGAAGIPEAGLVTMTLVFGAVGLPTHCIAILPTVDWFLDRCRTTGNVMGDVNVSCLLDGRKPVSPPTPPSPGA